jgi:hypothetical protein
LAHGDGEVAPQAVEGPRRGRKLGGLFDFINGAAIIARSSDAAREDAWAVREFFTLQFQPLFNDAFGHIVKTDADALAALVAARIDQFDPVANLPKKSFPLLTS